MKKTLLTLLATSSLINADENYRNFIWQIQGDAANTTHLLDEIDPEGDATALQGVYNSSVFQLWTIHRTTAAEYLLDEKTVSSYHPQATMTITSLDPYETIPRTRIDKPFTVTYTVAGIITNDPNVQDAAKSVVFDHRVIAYAPGAYTAPSGAPYTTHDHDPITTNGTHTHPNIISLLHPPGDVTKARGEEVFSIYANPDFGTVGASLLASARVQIWPIASGSFSGTNSTTIYSQIPTITISCTDLYPESNTYLRFYKTSDPGNAATSGVVGNYNPHSTVPESRSWTAEDLNEIITEDGTYTLQLFHNTVFNTIDFGSTQISVDRGIKINGNVNSSE